MGFNNIVEYVKSKNLADQLQEKDLPLPELFEELHSLIPWTGDCKLCLSNMDNETAHLHEGVIFEHSYKVKYPLKKNYSNKPFPTGIEVIRQIPVIFKGKAPKLNNYVPVQTDNAASKIYRYLIALLKHRQ